MRGSSCFCSAYMTFWLGVGAIMPRSSILAIAEDYVQNVSALNMVVSVWQQSWCDVQSIGAAPWKWCNMTHSLLNVLLLKILLLHFKRVNCVFWHATVFWWDISAVTCTSTLWNSSPVLLNYHNMRNMLALKSPKHLCGLWSPFTFSVAQNNPSDIKSLMCTVLATVHYNSQN